LSLKGETFEARVVKNHFLDNTEHMDADDAPTREEFDELGEKVTKLQHQFLAN